LTFQEWGHSYGTKTIVLNSIISKSIGYFYLFLIKTISLVFLNQTQEFKDISREHILGNPMTPNLFKIIHKFQIKTWKIRQNPQMYAACSWNYAIGWK
jgi:hypothetical protein